MLPRSADRPARKPCSPKDIAWHRTSLRAACEASRVTAALDAAMLSAAYPDPDRFAVRLAAEEAIVNAVKHGHLGDPNKRVRIAYRVGPRQVLVRVHDQGPGFDPARVPDPLAAENLERDSGRGLLLIHAYATWVRYNARGNRVTFCRNRSAS